MIKIDMDMPKTCSDCKFFHETRGMCHNSYIDGVSCKLGYIKNVDTSNYELKNRLKSTRFEDCQLVECLDSNNKVGD